MGYTTDKAICNNLRKKGKFTKVLCDVCLSNKKCDTKDKLDTYYVGADGGYVREDEYAQ